MNYLAFILFMDCLVCLCYGQLIQFGSCSNVTTQQYFQLDKFLGDWYEIQRFPVWYELNGQCALKTISSCEKKIEIRHAFVRDGVQYILHVNSTYNAGDDAVFVILESNIDPIGIPLTVLSTDYDNFAVIYGCHYEEDMNMRYISAWIMSRNTTLEVSQLESAQEQLSMAFSSSLVYLEDVEQDPDKCVYQWTAHVQAEYNDE